MPRIVAVAAVVVTLLSCRSTVPPDRPLAGVDGTFIALSVPDSAAAAAWYREKLGYEVIAQGEAPNKIARFALLRHGANVLELIEHAEARPLAAAGAKAAHQLHGIFKAGFTVADLDAMYAYVRARHVEIAYDLTRAKDVPMRTFTIRDNSGNLIQFFGK